MKEPGLHTTSGADQPLPNAPRAAGWELAALFLLLAAAAAGSAFFSYFQYREELIADRQQEVLGYAADKAVHLENWQASFREEMEPLSKDPLLAREMERWLARGARRDGSERDLLAELSSYLRGRKFLAIFVYDPRGEIRLAVNPRARPPFPLARLRALEAIRTRQGVLADLHRGNTPEDHKIVFDYIVPLMYSQGESMKAVAAVYLRIDPEATIYPLLRSEPDQRKGMDALLISRHGNRLLYLNNPSLHSQPWPEFGSEVEDPPTVTALFSRGTTGAFEGGDHRGAAVIGAVRPVAGTDWLVLAQGDRDALLSPLAARARATSGLAFGFIALLALALFWLWRQQRAEVSARNIEIESRRFREDILRDITERRRMGDLLRDQLNFINRLLETIPSPVFYKDENGRYLGCNKAFEQFLGLTKAEVVGKSVHDIAPQELADQYYAADRALFERPGVQVYEAQVKYADGSLHEVLFSKATFNKADGAVGGLVGVMLDITERKRAEAALRERENRLSILFERAGDIILVHDREGRILDVNRQACASLGYEREELVGMAVRDIDLHCVPGRPEGPWSTLAEGQTTTVEGLHRRKDGATFPVEMQVSLVRDGSDPWFLAVVRDVSERKHAEEIVRDARDRLRAVIHASPLAIVSLDLEGRITMWNPAAERIFGWRSLEALGRIPPFVPPEKESEFRALHRRVCDGESLTEIELWRQKKDGSPICVSLSIAPLYGPQRGVCGVIAVLADITAQQETAQQARLYARVFEASHDAIIITNPANGIIAVNRAFTDITGYTQEEVMGKNPKMLSSGRQDQGFYISMWTSIREDGHWQGEIWNRRKSGEVYPEWVTISAVRNAREEIANYIAIFSDISERKAAEEHINYLAQHDGLTGLPNRTLMQDRLQQALSAAGRAGGLVAVLFLDLDHFKDINDSLGHHVGDQLLIAVAERISDSVRGADTVSRIGGDEFVIILPTVAEADDIALVAEKILCSLSRRYRIDVHEINTTPSIGIAVYPGDGEDMGTLIRNADTAMYHAKKSGRNNYQFFTPDMNARGFERTWPSASE